MPKPNAPDPWAGPTIRTERLVLRSHRPGDLAGRMAITGDPVTMHFVGGPQGEADNWARILRYAGHLALFGYGVFAVEERASGTIIGEVGLGHFARGLGADFDAGVEAAWLLGHAWHGKGYAQEALGAAIESYEQAFGRGRMVCLIAPDNAPSLRLADRFGFATFREALYRDQPVLLMERPPSFPRTG